MKAPEYQVEIKGDRAVVRVGSFVKYSVSRNENGTYELLRWLHEDSSRLVGKYGTLRGAVNYAKRSIAAGYA